MKMKRRYMLPSLVLSCVLALFVADSAMAVTAEVVPDTISINSFYHGTKIVVSGEVAADEDVVVKMSSPGKNAHMRQKGKKGGLLWMNVGELEFGNVTDMFLTYSTEDIGSLLSREQQDKYAIGYRAFRRIVEVSPVSSDEEKEKWVDQFIKFKEKNRIYGEFSGKIETEVRNGKKTYQLNVEWPYQAAPQKYTVTVYAVKDNAVQDYKDVPVTVEQVGALKYISNQAFNNASVYGIISILIAIVSGFIVSVIFKGGGGGH